MTQTSEAPSATVDQEHEVFISYSRADGAFVRELQDGLASRGRRAWVDWQDIPPTAEWMTEIEGAIDEADAVVYVLSPDSIASRVCTEEIDHALGANKRIVPILRRDVEVANTPDAIARLNWIVATDGALDETLDKLIEALDTDLDRVRAHSKLLVRARDWDAKGEGKSLLLRGSELGEAESLIGADAAPLPTPEQTRFVVASRRAASSRQRRVISIVTVVAVLAAALGIFAWAQRSAAVTQQRTAVAQRNLARHQTELANSRAVAVQALLQLDVDPTVGALLAVEAERTASTPEAESAIHAAAQQWEGVERTLAAPPRDRYWTSLAFSADGHALAAGNSGGARAWDPATGEPIHQLENGDKTASVAFARDGRLLASATLKHVLVRDTENGRVIKRLEFSGFVNIVTFSPDGRRLAVGTWNGQLSLWDVRTWQKVAHASLRDPNVYDLAFDPSGRLLAAASTALNYSDGSVTLLNTRTGRRRIILTRHHDVVLSIAFSPGGQFAAGDAHGVITLLEAKTWRTIRRVELPATKHNGLGVTDVAFSTNARLLAAGSDGSPDVALIDPYTGRQVGAPTTACHASDAAQVMFDPAGTTLAVGCTDGQVVLVSIGSQFLLDARAFSLHFSPDGSTIATSHSDGTIRFWDPTSGEAIGPPVQLPETVHFAFSPDGGLIAAAGDEDGRLWLLDPTTRQPLRPPVDIGHIADDLAISPDGDTLALADRDGVVRLWDIASETQLGQLIGHTQGVVSVAFSPDGRLLASGGFDRTVLLWDLATREPIGEPLRGHTAWIYSVGFNPDGKSFASAGFDGRVILWSVATRKPIGSPLRGHTGVIYDAAFSPDGRVLASVSSDGTTRLWDVGTHQPIGQPLGGHTRLASDVEFSPDGTLLASASFDLTVKMWDSTAWSDDLVAVSKVLCGKVDRNLTPDEWRQYLPFEPFHATCPGLQAGR